MSRPILILGAGGSAHDVLDIVAAINAVSMTWEIVGFLDDVRPVGSCHLGFEVIGALEKASTFAGYAFVNAIASETSYRRLPAILQRTGLNPEEYATLVHPNASVSSRAQLGRGVTVNFGVSIGGGAVIGEHVLLCQGSTVGHDTMVGDYTILAPRAVISGNSHVGKRCYLGANSVTRQHTTIGEGALIGMGAVVIHDVAEYEVVVGNPARPLGAPRLYSTRLNLGG